MMKSDIEAILAGIVIIISLEGIAIGITMQQHSWEYFGVINGIFLGVPIVLGVLFGLFALPKWLWDYAWEKKYERMEKNGDTSAIVKYRHKTYAELAAIIRARGDIYKDVDEYGNTIHPNRCPVCNGKMQTIFDVSEGFISDHIIQSLNARLCSKCDHIEGYIVESNYYGCQGDF